MKIRILGNQSPYPQGDNGAGLGYLIEDSSGKTCLLDCGDGVVKNINIPNELEDLTIILSHLHEDHILGIYSLRYAVLVHRDLLKDLPNIPHLVFPTEPEQDYKFMFEKLLNYFKTTALNEHLKLDVGKMQISFARTIHPIPCYATKIVADGKVFVYTGDTIFTESMVDFTRGADVLLCEAGLLRAVGRPDDKFHIQTWQTGELARRAGVKKLLLTHFWPKVNPDVYLPEARERFENVEVAIQGMTYEI